MTKSPHSWDVYKSLYILNNQGRIVLQLLRFFQRSLGNFSLKNSKVLPKSREGTIFMAIGQLPSVALEASKASRVAQVQHGGRTWRMGSRDLHVLLSPKDRLVGWSREINWPP